MTMLLHRLDTAGFNRFLQSWFVRYGRHHLPWRRLQQEPGGEPRIDPYAVWISEVMLQQTQVGRVAGEYYPRFLAALPSLVDLALAPWEQVYRLWDGLGYYSRARNLQKAAVQVQEQHSGVLPEDQKTLQSLPGIGEYTSAAIMAFAYDQPVVAFDTNVQQVFLAFFPDQQPLGKANEVLHKAVRQGSGLGGRGWNAAVMDLASALRAGERFTAEFEQHISSEVRQAFQRKPTKLAQPLPADAKTIIDVGIACIHRDGRYLLQRYPGKKGREGLEFPGGKRESGESLRDCVKREMQEELGIQVSVRPAFMHIYRPCPSNGDTKNEHDGKRDYWRLHYHRCQIQLGEPQPKEGQRIEWIAPGEFDRITILGNCPEVLQKLQKMRV